MSSDVGHPDRLTLLIGEAIVAWSQIESTWAHIFFNLLFDGYGAKPRSDQAVTDDAEARNEPAQQRDRAAAVYFSVPNSRNQRRMVVALARVALADKPDAVSVISKLAARTDKLSEWRNRLAHAYYDRPTSWKNGKRVYGDVQVSSHGQHRFGVPEVEEQIKHFEELDAKMTHLLLAVADLDYFPEP
jgi:hypothetical protein